MKEAAGHILRVIAAFLLFILAAVLCIVLVPVALVHQFYISITREDRKARDILIGMKQFFTSIAASIDQFGNTAFAALFNHLLLVNDHLYTHGKQAYLFGNKDETISEVLGWNEAFFYGALSPMGKRLIDLLNFLENDHCYLAYQIGKQAAKDKLEVYKKLTRG